MKIEVDKTTFRATFQDANPLWKVVKKLSSESYLCEVIECPDYAGTQKAFLTNEIVASVEWEKRLNAMVEQGEQQYQSLKQGDVIHYNNGHNAFVRMIAHRVNGKITCRAIALVGDWRPHDLPNRRRDGTTYNPYHADKIAKGEDYMPNATNIYEFSRQLQKGTDPRKLAPINLKLPEMTPAEQKTAKQWKNIQAAIDALNDGDADPTVRIEAAKEILNRPLS